MKTTTAIPVFQVSNVEASLKHYTGIFGFSEDFRFGDYAGIKLGDVRLHLSGHSFTKDPLAAARLIFCAMRSTITAQRSKRMALS
jgi:hypothetical protein